MPLVAAAAVTGGVALMTSSAANRAQSAANRRALAASENAASKAERFEREQNDQNRADDDRTRAEDKRRWDIDQANIASAKAEQDARQRYEDQIRYRKMVTIAQLTGQPMPEAMPNFGGGAAMPTIGTLSGKQPVSGPLMSQPSRVNAMIAAPPDPMFDPLVNQRVPLSKLSRPRY